MTRGSAKGCCATQSPAPCRSPSTPGCGPSSSTPSTPRFGRKGARRSVEWLVLGPIEVTHDGTPLAVGRRRERVLLARLLLSRNQVVSAETLIDDLWGDAPPDGAPQSLWVSLSRL